MLCFFRWFKFVHCLYTFCCSRCNWLCVSMQIVLLHVSNTQLIVRPYIWFLLVFMINHCARLKVYICYVLLSKGATVHPLMLLNVNTPAISVIEVCSRSRSSWKCLWIYICRAVSTVDVNEWAFCVNEQQKVYYVDCSFLYQFLYLHPFPIIYLYQKIRCPCQIGHSLVTSGIMFFIGK